MKKLFSLALIFAMLLGLTACGLGGMTTVYVVTEQKDYRDGALFSSTAFEYDEKGRPVLIEQQYADGSGRKAQLEYDQHGNLLREVNTQLYASGDPYVLRQEWDLTYDGDLLIHAQRQSNGQTDYVLDLHYDDDGRLIRVDYEQGGGSFLWQIYEYDKAGRLAQETRCSRAGSNSFSYVRVCYRYDSKGRLSEQYLCSARADEEYAPEELQTLEFHTSDTEHYFFYYDKAGDLAYVGDGEEDTYEGGKAAIYSDENYTFDANGNLVRVQKDENSWTEYTYEVMKLKKTDAVIHKRLIHGVSVFTLPFTAQSNMEPLHWEICSPMLYHYHLCYMSFYYLIPYPQFELFLDK